MYNLFSYNCFYIDYTFSIQNEAVYTYTRINSPPCLSIGRVSLYTDIYACLLDYLETGFKVTVKVVRLKMS